MDTHCVPPVKPLPPPSVPKHPPKKDPLYQIFKRYLSVGGLTLESAGGIQICYAFIRRGPTIMQMANKGLFIGSVGVLMSKSAEVLTIIEKFR